MTDELPRAKADYPEEPATPDAYLEREVIRLAGALRAIKARIDGEYDHPELMRLGALGDQDEDILRIIEEVLPE